MKYMDDYRNRDLVNTLLKAIADKSRLPVRFMEVCGGHTLAIRKFGIQNLIPQHIELVSGPGCPVCVTNRKAIDYAIALARIPDVILATYGDLIRVPGSESTLNQERALGADIRIVYSTMDALEIARNNPHKKIVFPGIGFETTTPSSAVAILEAERQDIRNFSVFSMHKTMPAAMAALIDQGVHIDGYIGPGHVSTIAGANMYKPLLDKHKISVVISGFEPVDLLQSILMLVEMHVENQPGIKVQYKRVVNSEGNIKALQLVDKVFEPCNDEWRGLGIIPGSGLAIRRKYEQFDASLIFNPTVKSTPEPKGCLCGEVLRGIIKPTDCGLFAKVCTPVNPIGACMVSGEGACQAYFNYR